MAIKLGYAIHFVSDMDRAVAFYRDTVGLELKFSSPEWSEFATGTTTLALRVERQLGYKMAKYVMRIELVDTFHSIAGGRGGYWEDQGYNSFSGS